MTNIEAAKRIQEHMTIHKLREPNAVYITEALNMAVQVLINSPENEQWIKTKDRLPEDNLCVDWHKDSAVEFTTVLVYGYFHQTEDLIVTTANRIRDTSNDGEWYWSNNLDEIIAWRPMPAPPSK